MEPFEQIALDNFGALVINKSFARKAGFGSRAIPVYVREWIVAYYVGDSLDLMDEARAKIADFVRRFVPDKGDRESVKNQLYEQNDVKLLDDFSVQVNLAKGDRYLQIPYLDETQSLDSAADRPRQRYAPDEWHLGCRYAVVCTTGWRRTRPSHPPLVHAIPAREPRSGLLRFSPEGVFDRGVGGLRREFDGLQPS